jgi:Fe2+ or Zn2+ uptake regulation protein
MAGVYKSTIYRTLEFLETAGCVYKSEVEYARNVKEKTVDP